jgi:citrate lyase subunit beta/citryl-CoA lyase
VLDASEAAAAQRRPAFKYDERMVDAPIIERARKVLQKAH